MEREALKKQRMEEKRIAKEEEEKRKLEAKRAKKEKLRLVCFFDVAFLLLFHGLHCLILFVCETLKKLLINLFLSQMWATSFWV